MTKTLTINGSFILEITSSSSCHRRNHKTSTATSNHRQENQQAEESTVITSNTNSDNKTIQDISLMQSNKSWMFTLAGAFLVLAMFWYLLAVTLWFRNDASNGKYTFPVGNKIVAKRVTPEWMVWKYLPKKIFHKSEVRTFRHATK
jgi:hypothetical protein